MKANDLPIRTILDSCEPSLHEYGDTDFCLEYKLGNWRNGDQEHKVEITMSVRGNDKEPSPFIISADYYSYDPKAEVEQFERIELTDEEKERFLTDFTNILEED